MRSITIPADPWASPILPNLLQDLRDMRVRMMKTPAGCLLINDGETSEQCRRRSRETRRQEWIAYLQQMRHHVEGDIWSAYEEIYGKHSFLRDLEKMRRWEPLFEWGDMAPVAVFEATQAKS